MTELTCIECPNGCNIQIDKNSSGELKITGNNCERGFRFAVSEMTSPKRTICTTARTAFEDVPVVPVRVSDEIPKNRIFDVMREIDKICVKRRLGRGDAIITNVLDLGVDVIITSDRLKKYASNLRSGTENE